MKMLKKFLYVYEKLPIFQEENHIFFGTDRGKDFYNSVFQNFLKNNNIKYCSRNSSLGAVFAEKFNLANRNLLERPVLERNDANWVDVLSTKTKQHNNKIHFSTKLTPKQASIKKNRGFVYQKLLDKRKKIKPKYKSHDLARVADLKKTFSKRYTTN